LRCSGGSAGPAVGDTAVAGAKAAPGVDGPFEGAAPGVADAAYPSAVSLLIWVPRPHIVHVVTYFVPRGMTGMKNKVKYLRILVRA
jgi:hypothetical protein